jgi:hypothetical protein
MADDTGAQYTDISYWAECVDCGAESGYGRTPAAAAKDWNARKPADAACLALALEALAAYASENNWDRVDENEGRARDWWISAGDGYSLAQSTLAKIKELQGTTP